MIKIYHFLLIVSFISSKGTSLNFLKEISRSFFLGKNICIYWSQWWTLWLVKPCIYFVLDLTDECNKYFMYQANICLCNDFFFFSFQYSQRAISRYKWKANVSTCTRLFWRSAVHTLELCFSTIGQKTIRSNYLTKN